MQCTFTRMRNQQIYISLIRWSNESTHAQLPTKHKPNSIKRTGCGDVVKICWSTTISKTEKRTSIAVCYHNCLTGRWVVANSFFSFFRYNITCSYSTVQTNPIVLLNFVLCLSCSSSSYLSVDLLLCQSLWQLNPPFLTSSSYFCVKLLDFSHWQKLCWRSLSTTNGIQGLPLYLL